MARLVTLDVTGTCIRVTRSVGYHYSKIAQEFGLNLAVTQLDQGFRAAFKRANSQYPCFGVAQGMTSQQWWNMLVSDSLTAAGVEEKAGDLHEDVGKRLFSYFADSSRWETFVDTAKALEDIKMAGLKLGAISNFDERLGGILSGLGIAKYFDFVLTSYEAGSAKPDPKIFQLALQKGEVSASSALHVGDSYELDYVAAKKLGMIALHLVRDSVEHVEEGTVVIHSLEEVLQHTGNTERVTHISKKYQQLERDKLQHIKDQEKRVTRERSLLLSKQTAQRQRALEEKKRAMAVAEEQRRRKALEERRKAQHEATARFKSAIVRMKSTPRAKHKPMDNVEIYLPDKAQAKPKNSSAVQNGHTQTRNSPGSQQRVAYGKDVEIKNSSLQRRTPSLDDVLSQIRGGGEKSTLTNGHIPNKSHTHGRINVHHHPTAPSTALVQHQARTTVTHTDQRNSPMLRERSASDPNLNSLAARSSTTATKAQQSSVASNHSVVDASSEAGKLKVVEVEMSSSASDELMLFKPVTSVGGGRLYTTLTSVAGRLMQSDDGTRVVSPEPADSSTSSDRSFSPPLNDSLDQPASRYVVSSVAKQMRASRQQHEQAARRRVKLTSQRRPDSGDSLENEQKSSLKVMGVPATAHTHPTSHTPPPPRSAQPIYICQENESSSDDVGDSDSLNEEGSYPSRRRPAPHQSRKQSRQRVDVSDTVSHDTSRNNQGAESRVETQEQNSTNHVTAAEVAVKEVKPKIVGILKKTSTSSIESSQTGLSTGALAMEAGLDGSLSSTASSTTKSQKRVRFFDQVGSNNRHSHTPRSDNVWSKVLPNSFNNSHIPNSAFTPKMRLFLSSKASTIPPAAVSGPPKRPTAPSIINGITVHIPVVPADSSLSHSHQQSPQHSSSGREVATKEAQSSSKEDQDGDNCSRNVKFSSESTSPSNGQNACISTPPSTTQPSSSTRLSDENRHDRALDKTPTDNEINEMWEQIRTCLDRDDNKQSTVPVQMYPFQVPPVNGMQRYTTTANSVYVREMESDTSTISLQRDQNQSPAAGSQYSDFHGHQQAYSKASEQNSVRLVHRQSNRSRPMRCHHQAHMHTTIPSQLSKRQQTNNFHHNHSATYPYSEQEQPTAHRQPRGYPPNAQISSRDPELVVRATASTINGRTTPTSLSLEEQRLLQSIEKLNQQMKDHIVRPQDPVFQPPPSPEPHSYPPEYYRQHHRHLPSHLHPHPPPPHNSRTRDLAKQGGVLWHQQATPPSTINNSRRTKTHRHDFYNT